MLTANSSQYGSLPMFPCLDYRPFDEAKIERHVEHMMNAADRRFLAGEVTQSQYDAWVIALENWAAAHYRKLANRPNMIDDGMGGTYQPGVILSV